MKKTICAMTLMIMAVAAVAGWAQTRSGDNGPGPSDQRAAGERKETMVPKKILVAYFSHTGNTREIAKQIQLASGGDLFEIQPVDPYPTEYRTLVDQAKREINAGYRPALKTKPEGLGGYDIIFVGSPNWWSTIAPPVAAFLAGHDVSGKTIVPFMTHEGTGLGHSVDDIRKLCPKSTVLDGRAFRGRSVKDARDEVFKWVGETVNGRRK